MNVVDIVIAATLGGSVFVAITGGGHLFIQAERYKRRRRRLDDLIHNAKMRETRLKVREESLAIADTFQLNADTPALMCMGCGKSVPTVDGFTIADHDCPYAEQRALFPDDVCIGVASAHDTRKIPIGFNGHLHLNK